MANKGNCFPNGEVREDPPQKVTQADRDFVNSLESKKKEGNGNLIYVEPAEYISESMRKILEKGKTSE